MVAAEDFAVTLAVPVLLLMVALMVAEPCALVRTVPPLLTVATDASDVDQETLAVTSLLVESLYRAVAANCCDWPTVSEGELGETVID